MVLARIIVFLLSFVAGITLIRGSVWMVRNFGYMDWAERYLGSGGTYSAWKLFGILIIIGGFLYAVGSFNIAPNL